MFNHVLKWSLLITVWRKYGVVLKWLPVVLLVLFVIHTAHNDFVGYVEVSENNSNLAISYALKWLAILATVAGYWWYANTALKETKTDSKKESALVKRDKNKHKKRDIIEEKVVSSEDGQEECRDQEDPFAEIRKRKRLRTQAEIMIDNKDDASR